MSPNRFNSWRRGVGFTWTSIYTHAESLFQQQFWWRSKHNDEEPLLIRLNRLLSSTEDNKKNSRFSNLWNIFYHVKGKNRSCSRASLSSMSPKFFAVFDVFYQIRPRRESNKRIKDSNNWIIYNAFATFQIAFLLFSGSEIKWKVFVRTSAWSSLARNFVIKIDGKKANLIFIFIRQTVAALEKFINR